LLPLCRSVSTASPHHFKVPKPNFTPPEETKEHPLPKFDYPEAAPMRFDQRYNGDRIEITLQYELLVKPGERPHIKASFKTSGCRRIAAVCLRITAHDNVVVDVQPRLRKIGPERKSEVVTTRAHEKKSQWKAGAGVQQMATLTLEGSGENDDSYSTTESGTRSSTATIIGQTLRTFTDNDTADWNLNEAKTAYGGDGIKGYDEGDGLRFTLLEMPHRISYDCWITYVNSDGSERTIHRNSFGFWAKHPFQ
jgi:hypothetical protein